MVKYEYMGSDCVEQFWILEADEEYEVHDNKHDKGYKYILSVKRMFVQLLRSFVDQGWVSKIDEDSVERIDKSFILQDFKEKEADLIYKVKFDGKEVFFYILLELQSTVDFQMPFRLLQYMLEIWRTILKDTGKNIERKKYFTLPVIVPCVLYNGKDSWTACGSFREMLDQSGEFGDYVLDFRYILFDVKRYDEKKLLKLANVIGGMFFIDQKPSYEELLSRMEVLAERLKDISQEDFELLKIWVKNIIIRGMPKDKTVEIEENINQSGEVASMVYAAEIAIRNKMKEEAIRGRLQGELEGKIEGKIEDIIELLRVLGELPEQIEGVIRQERDLVKLSRWLRAAARAENLEEFTEVM